MANKYILPAKLDINNIVSELQHINTLIKSSEIIEVCCSKIDVIDTCGLAGLLELKTNSAVKLVDISPQTLDLCRLYQIQLS